jgi:three-Cys-motif partner protein
MAKHYNWKIGEPLPILGAHSLAKHEVFSAYTSRYIPILSPMLQKTELNLTIIDGFCGGGAYRVGDGIVAGSPLLLLRAVRASEVELAAASQNGFRVRADFFFVDQNKHHIDFLQSELSKSEFASEVGRSIHVATDTFERQAPAIISAIKAKGPSHRALFFLDQYGWSAVSFGIIRQIFSSLNNPEVLITFSVDTLIDYLTTQTAKMRSGQAIDLDPALGEALADLRTESGQRAIIQGFLYKHIIQNTGAAFYTPFFIHSPGSHRSYWLLHLAPTASRGLARLSFRPKI